MGAAGAIAVPRQECILPLSAHPAALPQLARWLHGEWLRHWGLTLAQAEAELRARLGPGPLPVAFVALRRGRPVGTISLVLDAPPYGRGELCVLSGLFVPPAWRGQGVGAALCRHALAAADALGLPPPALYTANAVDFYRRLGWGAPQACVVQGSAGAERAFFMEYGDRKEVVLF